MPPSDRLTNQRRLSSTSALGWSLFLTILIGAIGTLFAYMPDFRGTPILALITAWSLAFAIGVAGFWNARNPHWLAKSVICFCLTTLFLAGAIHALSPYLTGWLWIVMLAGVYLLAWILPWIDPTLARRLSEEQVSPKTCLGRNQVLIVLFLAVLGALIVGIYNVGRVGLFHPIMLFIGVMSALLTVGGGQYFSYYIRQEWEKQSRSKKEVD